MDARFASVTVRALGLTRHLDMGVLLWGLPLPVRGLCEGVVRSPVYDDGLIQMCDAYRSFQRLQQPHFFGDGCVGVCVPDPFSLAAKSHFWSRRDYIKACHTINSLSKSPLEC